MTIIQRAGLLFLAKTTQRILLVYQYQSWTVPTFIRTSTLLDDAKPLLNEYSVGKLLPIELYLSKDRGFEYSTYICLVDNEFNPSPLTTMTFSWATLDNLPKGLHNGLKNTLTDTVIRTKINTVIELEQTLRDQP